MCYEKTALWIIKQKPANYYVLVSFCAHTFKGVSILSWNLVYSLTHELQLYIYVATMFWYTTSGMTTNHLERKSVWNNKNIISTITCLFLFQYAQGRLSSENKQWFLRRPETLSLIHSVLFHNISLTTPFTIEATCFVCQKNVKYPSMIHLHINFFMSTNKSQYIMPNFQLLFYNILQYCATKWDK